jgi:predicted AlkP superfamily pyrophosphatase or phosphodiesterase
MNLRLVASTLLLLAACRSQSVAPTAESAAEDIKTPQAIQQAVDRQETPPIKLVVGLVIDQMRPEYLTRFADGFTEGGFKRLLREGFVNYNTHYNYIPTFTGPGHASIFSGATPATHGIVGNGWYSREEARSVYCVEDPEAKPIGSTTGIAASPHRMLVTNLADELKLATNRRAKVVGVSLKDRSAVLPAGHIPDGAYWYDKSTGRFISSTYYMQQLPGWMQQFNGRRLADQYLDSTWTLLLPEAAYRNSGPDNQPYERVFKGKDSPTFPYNLAELHEQNGGYDILSSTPWGNTLVTELALAALQGEALGQDETPDLFTVSYSTPDIMGHDFGLRSRELHDMYLRLDRELARLLDALDEQVGPENYVLFLTADHAAADVPQFLLDERLPAGYYPEADLKVALNGHLQQKFKQQNLVEYITNDQVYLNHKRILGAKLNLNEVQEEAVNFLILQPYTVDAYTGLQMRQNEYRGGIRHMLQMGYYRPRSGDVLFVLNPAWMHQISYATTHGSGYNYDTHVPLIWYGSTIKQGGSYRRQNITDIAPTLTHMLGIGLPNGATGEPILEVLK